MSTELEYVIAWRGEPIRLERHRLREFGGGALCYFDPDGELQLPRSYERTTSEVCSTWITAAGAPERFLLEDAERDFEEFDALNARRQARRGPNGPAPATKKESASPA